jgi:hypothetical protein
MRGTTIATMKRIFPLALLLLGALSMRAELPFIENDYARAVREASARNVPIFVEAWAPW